VPAKGAGFQIYLISLKPVHHGVIVDAGLFDIGYCFSCVEVTPNGYQVLACGRFWNRVDMEELLELQFLNRELFVGWEECFIIVKRLDGKGIVVMQPLTNELPHALPG